MLSGFDGGWLSGQTLIIDLNHLYGFIPSTYIHETTELKSILIKNQGLIPFSYCKGLANNHKICNTFN